MGPVYSILLLILVIFIFALIYAIWINNYFKKRSVKLAIKPLPFFGHMLDIFFHKEHFVDTLTKVYSSNHGQRYTGFYAFLNPIVMIRDLELIKQIGVKDFDHFVDHKVFMDEEAEPLFGSNLFFLRGQKWRDMRAALSPAFTGSKMKAMFPLIVECSKQFTDFLEKEMKQITEEKITEIEIKEIVTRFTNDVIASTAFGFKINSFDNKCNEFYMMGKRATNFSGWQFIKFQLYAVFPDLMKKLKLSLFPKEVVNFFKNLVHTAINDREKSGLIRHDMIHLLMLAKKGSLQYDTDLAQPDDMRFSSVEGAAIKQEIPRREWSNDDLTAQAIAFIVAGFGTPSSLLCFVTYELARHPDIQEKLQQEIDEMFKKTDGKPTYSDIQVMKYMDMVISETLRLWPPDGFLERVCVKSYTLPPQNEQSDTKYYVREKDEFIIPIYSIHHDPEYFPNPNTFDPERFSENNKSRIIPFTYLPFGIGPRLCIGARFALMEAKTVLFNLLARFEFSVVEKTKIPFVLAKDTFNMHPENGLWLGIRKRNMQNRILV